VGKLRIKLGKLVEARDVLLRVTRFPAAPDEPEVYTAARKEARKLADELTPRIPSLRIEIEGVDDDATLAVTVGGVVVPPSTLKFPRSVSPGDHEVVARAPGYKPARAVVHIEEREQKTVELRLEKDPNYEPVEPRPGFKPPPGGQDGGVPPEPGPELSPLVWVGIAVAGVGVVAGAITGGIALNNSNNIEDGCPTRVCNIELENDINATRVLSHVSTASFALAGAGAAVMVVGLVLSDWSGQPGDDQTRLEPVLGPGMLGVRGRF
jgi:hypothetical protein